MSFRLGCDLVCIARFAERVRDGGTPFLERIFLPREYQDQTTERLAGIFAAKEALCKAMAQPPGRWLEVCIEHEPSGAPRAVLLAAHPEVVEVQVSVSHDGEYALAFALARVR